MWHAPPPRGAGFGLGLASRDELPRPRTTGVGVGSVPLYVALVLMGGPRMCTLVGTPRSEAAEQGNVQIRKMWE